MQIKLEKVMSRNPKRFSALWAPRGMEGILLLKQPNSRLKNKTGWCWLVLDDHFSNSIQGLRGQMFLTRVDALQALEIALQL